MYSLILVVYGPYHNKNKLGLIDSDRRSLMMQGFLVVSIGESELWLEVRKVIELMKKQMVEEPSSCVKIS